MNGKPIAIAIAGVSGRMGQALLQVFSHMEGLRLSVLLVNKGSSFPVSDREKRWDISLSDVKVVDTLEATCGDFDVLVDFTRPAGTLNYLSYCRKHGKNMVIGTTGFTASEKSLIEEATQHIAIVCAANFSVGVTIVLKLLETAAHLIRKDTDIDIIDLHHRHKVDAPSGTALAMGEVLANALGGPNAMQVHSSAEPKEGPANRGTSCHIGFSSVRTGDIVGEHTVLFSSEGERIEITHKASSRASFAKGALLAASWISHKEKGLFDMRDVLHT